MPETRELLLQLTTRTSLPCSYGFVCSTVLPLQSFVVSLFGRQRSEAHTRRLLPSSAI